VHAGPNAAGAVAFVVAPLPGPVVTVRTTVFDLDRYS
jgi:hypothetical protein